MAVTRALAIAVASLVTSASVAAAQPGMTSPGPSSDSIMDPSTALRAANAAARAGNWAEVTRLTAPLLDPRAPIARAPVAPVDRAEALRLHGLAAFFSNQPALAERDFVAYLHLELDGHLDPALYPPEAINFFNDVRARHAAELHAARPSVPRYFALDFLPPVGQFQNGERTTGWILLGALAGFAATNITTYFVLRDWCRDPGDTCDATGANHFHAAHALSILNAISGVGLIATYAFGVYDGVRGYRRARRAYIAPDVSYTTDMLTLGLRGSF